MICTKHKLYFPINKCPKCETERKELELKIWENKREILRIDNEIAELEMENAKLSRWLK